MHDPNAPIHVEACYAAVIPNSERAITMKVTLRSDRQGLLLDYPPNTISSTLSKLTMQEFAQQACLPSNVHMFVPHRGDVGHCTIYVVIFKLVCDFPSFLS